MVGPRLFEGYGRACFQCVKCGQWFERYVSSMRHPDMTCGTSCSAALKNSKTKYVPRKSLTCESCGEGFEVTAARYHKARFCSDACKNTHQQGVGHPNWKGGVSRTRRERDIIEARIAAEGCCEECGATRCLQGHHIKWRSTHPDLREDPENIQVLCVPCHAAKHPDIAALIDQQQPRTGAIKRCAACDSEFYVKRSRLGAAFYCSRPCGFEGRRLGLHLTRASP